MFVRSVRMLRLWGNRRAGNGVHHLDIPYAQEHEDVKLLSFFKTCSANAFDHLEAKKNKA